MVAAEQWSLAHDPRPQPRVSSITHPQVQVHSSEQHGTTTAATGTTAVGRNPQVQDITTTVHRRIQHLRRMEVQDDSILGITRPSTQQTAVTNNRTEQSTGQITNDQLENAAPSQAVAEQRVQLSNNLHYLLVSTCDGPASTICRQNMRGNGFETWRLIHTRYSIPTKHWAPNKVTQTTT